MAPPCNPQSNKCQRFRSLRSTRSAARASRERRCAGPRRGSSSSIVRVFVALVRVLSTASRNASALTATAPARRAASCTARSELTTTAPSRSVAASRRSSSSAESGGREKITCTRPPPGAPPVRRAPSKTTVNASATSRATRATSARSAVRPASRLSPSRALQIGIAPDDVVAVDEPAHQVAQPTASAEIVAAQRQRQRAAGEEAIEAGAARRRRRRGGRTRAPRPRAPPSSPSAKPEPHEVEDRRAPAPTRGTRAWWASSRWISGSRSTLGNASVAARRPAATTARP